MNEQETCWVLDAYCDKVSLKAAKVVDAQDAYGSRCWNRPPTLRFASRAQALQSMLDRAERKLQESKLAVKRAESRVKKCRKKLQEGLELA